MKKIITTIILAGAMIAPALAQLAPMKSQFFINPYLVNPAMAGLDQRASVYANYSTQWNKIDGAPVLLSLSASTPISERASVGLNIINDKAGLLGKTQAQGSFSYHVPLAEGHSLRFGVSLTWAQDRIDMGLASSSATADPTLSRYNDRESYLDGNFGATYQLKNFEAQFSYLNLNQKRSNQFSTVDYATFYSSVSYKIDMSGWTLKPLIAYRGVRNYDALWDVAAEWKFTDLSLYTMYHNNESVTGGVGYDYKKSLNMSLFYNSQPSNLRGFSGGIFDLVLGYRF